MQEIIFLFISGLIGGFLAGYTGVGGGIIYIVVLPFVFKEEVKEENTLAAIIVANSIFGIFVASLISVATHARLKTLYFKESALVSIPAFLTSLVILIFYVNTSNYSYTYFNLFIIILMTLVLLIYLLNSRKRNIPVEDTAVDETSQVKYIMSGAISGVVSSLGGVGGAITLIPLMQHWQKISVKMAKSLSLTMILLMTGGLSFYNLLIESNYNDNFTGLINLRLITPMLIGILLTSWYGVKRAHHSKSKKIEVTFIVFISIVLINKFYILVS